VRDLLRNKDLTLEGWDGRPKRTLTPIDADAIDAYWHDARLKAKARGSSGA
jgi:hypothetical protein